MGEFDIKKLKNVIVQFEIPVSFDVLNSFNKEDEGMPYMVQVDNIPAKIHFNRIYDYRYSSDFELTQNNRMDEDRSALLSYTQVQVWFDKQMIDSGKIDKSLLRLQPYQFIEISIPYLNKFINVYKGVTHQFWIRRIVIKDIFSYVYILRDTEGKNEIINAQIPEHHILEFQTGQGFHLEDSQDQTLRHNLLSPYYSFQNDMFFLMIDNFHLGRYNLALVQSATLFENFIYTELNERLTKSKLDRIKKKEQCGCLAGITEVCTRGLKEHFNFDFEVTEEWQNLKNDMLKYRNKIVHGELTEEITQQQCGKALDAVGAAKKLLLKNVFMNS